MSARCALIGRSFVVIVVVLAAAVLTAEAQPQRPMPPQMRDRMPPGAAQPGQPPAPGAVKPRLSWIDVHLHLVTGRGSSRPDWGGAVETAIRDMDQFGIAMALVMPPPQVETQPGVYDADAFAGALTRYRGRFASLGGGGTLNSTLHRYADPVQVTDGVKRRFATAAEKLIDGGAVGFGEMASLHVSAASGHPYEFVPADHPLMLVLADVAAKRDVPIDLHLDAVDAPMPTPAFLAERSSANPPVLPETLAALERLLAHNRKANIVWAHAGSDPIGGMSAAAVGRLMGAHPNLYVSLRIVGAPAPLRNKVLTPTGLDPAWDALLTRHADRFVIGTDSFMVAPTTRGSGPGTTFAERNTPKLQATVHFLSLLSPDVARTIGRDNAIRLYKLPVK